LVDVVIVKLIGFFSSSAQQYDQFRQFVLYKSSSN